MKRLAAAPTVGECDKQLLERVGDIVGRRAEPEAPRNAAAGTDTAADEEVEPFDLLAAAGDENSLKADIGDPMLPARIRAAGHVQLDDMIERREAVVELARQTNAELLGLGDRKLAELAAGAGQRPTLKRQPVEWHARRTRGDPERLEPRIRDVEYQNVLRCRGA